MHQVYKKELLGIFAKIGSKADMDTFLSAILSPSEYEDIILRLQIVKLLEKGLPQREIAEKLGVSIAKVTHGSRELQSKKNGFKKIFKLYYESGF